MSLTLASLASVTSEADILLLRDQVIRVLKDDTASVEDLILADSNYRAVIDSVRMHFLYIKTILNCFYYTFPTEHMFQKLAEVLLPASIKGGATRLLLELMRVHYVVNIRVNGITDDHITNLRQLLTVVLAHARTYDYLEHRDRLLFDLLIQGPSVCEACVNLTFARSIERDSWKTEYLAPVAQAWNAELAAEQGRHTRWLGEIVTYIDGCTPLPRVLVTMIANYLD
jgi:hypothetical protein